MPYQASVHLLHSQAWPFTRGRCYKTRGSASTPLLEQTLCLTLLLFRFQVSMKSATKPLKLTREEKKRKISRSRWLIHPFSSRHHRLQNWFCFKARFTGKESKSNKDTVVWMITVSGTSREPVGHSAQLTPHVLTTLRPPPQIKSQTFRSTYLEAKRCVSCCSSCLIKSSSSYLSSLFSFPMTSVS